MSETKQHKWTMRLYSRVQQDDLLAPLREMKKPLSIEQCDELLQKYPAKLVYEKMLALAEWQETQTAKKQKVSAFRTLTMWCAKDLAAGWREAPTQRTGFLTTYDGAITFLERRGMKASDLMLMFDREVIEGKSMYRKRV